MKIIGIVGSRRRDFLGDFRALLMKFSEIYEPGDTIVSSGCPKGGDRFAEKIASDNNVPIKIYYPEWDKHGKSAGFVRNGLIAEDADILLALCADDRTGGTEDTIKKFRKSKPKGVVFIV